MRVDSKANIFLLIFLLLLPPVLGWFGYYLSVGSDQYEVIRFAEDLARGTIFRSHPVFDLVKDRTEPGRLYVVHYGGYLMKDGRMYCKYAVGYPLILALSLRLFGFPSVFFVNFFILSLLLLITFLIGRVHFRDEASPFVPALSAALLLFLLGEKLWDLSVTPHGDVASVLFAVASVYGLLRALPPGGGAKALWLVASFYFLNRTVVKVSAGRWAVSALLISLAVLAGLLPVFAQNYLVSGKVLNFTQAHEIHLEPVAEAVKAAGGSASPVSLRRSVADIFLRRSYGWGIGNIHAALPRMSFRILCTFGPFFSLLFLGGLAVAWSRPETRHLFLPAILTFLVFYSGWVRPLERYLIIAYPFIALVVLDGVLLALSAARSFPRSRLFLVALGAALVAGDYALRFWQRSGASPAPGETGFLSAAVEIPALVLLFLCLRPRRFAGTFLNLSLASAILLASLPVLAARPHLFQFPQARRFREEMGKICRPPSLLFATKFLTQTVDLFTDSVSIRPFDLDFAFPDRGQAYDLLLRNGWRLYLIDNLGKRDAGAFLPSIRDYFSVTPAGTLAGKEFNLEERFGKPVCTVYAIEPWKDRAVDLALATAAPVDYRLTLDLRRIWDSLPPRSSVSAALNGAPFPARFENGVNFLRLPAAAVSSPRSLFALSSDQNLPADVRVDFRWAVLDQVVEFGAAAAVPDRLFLEAAADEKEEGGFRTIRGKARIAIPPGVGGERRSAEFVVRRPGDGKWSAALDGAPLGELKLRPSAGPQAVEIVLPASAGPSPRSWLTISGDSPIVLETLRIKTWSADFSLPTPERGPYLLKAGLSVPPGAREVALRLNGEKLAATRSPGTLWALLTEPALRWPVSHLRLETEGAALHLSILAPVVYPFRVEPGASSGREFQGGGFYPPELYLGQTPFAWTTGEAEIYLPVAPAPGEGLQISLGYIGGRPPGVPPARVSLRLDGRFLAAFDPEPGLGEAVFPIPPELARPGIARLTIDVNPWCPAESAFSADVRKLGLMVRSVEARAVRGGPLP